MMMDPFPPTAENALDAVDKDKELASLPASVNVDATDVARS